MNQESGFVKYFVIIIVILAVVFLSQLAYTRAFSNSVISKATNPISSYAAKGANWVASIVYPKISGGVEASQNALQTTQQKISDSENVLKKVENYFSNVANSLAGKTNDSCQTSPTGTSTGQ